VINFLIASLLGLFFVGCNNPQSNKKLKTIENLKAAYLLETTASIKYAAFAQKTKEEGMERLSVLFLSVSKAKSIYSDNFKAEILKLGAKVDSVKPEFVVNTTLLNLHAANESETDEFTKLYPKFIKDAREEKSENAEKLFTWILETEKKHTVFFGDAIQSIKQNWTNAFYTLYFICPSCGNIYYPHQSEDVCKICGTQKSKFIHIG
jgi:rubrerythrin